MKKIIFVLSVIVFSGFTFIQSDKVVDYLKQPGPFSFYGDEFILGHTEHGIENYYRQEYLIKGEKHETYNKQIFIELSKTVISIKDVVNKKVKELENRKKTDLVCAYTLTDMPTNNEYLLEYITSVGPTKAVKQVEWNVCRYRVFNTAKGDRFGIQIYGFSMRGYGDYIYNFFDYQKPNKDKIIEAMKSAEYPKIDLGK
jgi:hypothetical protein